MTHPALAMVQLSIDVRRPELLNLNQRIGYMARHRRTQIIRGRAANAWVAAGQPRLDRATLTVHVTYPPTARDRDVHNLTPTFKAAIDGFVNPAPAYKLRGLLPDDNDQYLTGPDPRPTTHTTNEPGLYQFEFVFTALHLTPDQQGATDV